MSVIRVGVVGATGKMGREILKAVTNDEATEVIFGVGLVDEPTILTVEGKEIPVYGTLKEAFEKHSVDTIIDFTNAAAFRENAPIALAQGVNLVTGTTGLDHSEIEAFGKVAEEKGKCLFYAANYAIGAVLMMEFAEQAAKFMPEVEIIEFHHDQKKDAPSGTAVATARKIATVRAAHEQGLPGEIETLDGARGANFEGMHIHSVRMPGYNAHQEVIFGGLGQTLTIRHDSINRESFMPGIVYATKEIFGMVGLVEGLDTLMFEK